MVRIIAGSLVMVGCGKRSPEWISDVIAARHRPAAGPTAPPQGLVLVSIELATTAVAPTTPAAVTPASLPCDASPNSSEA
jgi:tRNA pseudouridine38-40 synthase